MAAPLDITEVDSLAEWEKISGAEAIKDNMLRIVEVYAKWCGPSQACMTTYRMFRDEFIEQKRRLRLYRVCASQLAPELPAEFDALKHDARPTFWLMLNGEKLGTVAGVNMPTLEKLVTALIPDGFLEDEEDEEATDNVQDE